LTVAVEAPVKIGAVIKVSIGIDLVDVEAASRRWRRRRRRR
jgi:hypothetical protein